jgi:GTP cyclohydrolase I
MNKLVSNRREKAVKALLSTISGEDEDRQGLADTPKRVAKMYNEIFSGYSDNEETIFSSKFKTDNSQMVIIKDIDYWSHCEHHMVPFFGKVHIGYIPNGEVLGLSKFARLVEMYARRLQIQEQMTFQIAEAIEKNLQVAGVAVVVTGTHLCMAMRGVKKSNSITVTNDMRGCFRDEQATRAEFFNSIHNTLT